MKPHRLGVRAVLALAGVAAVVLAGAQLADAKSTSMTAAAVAPRAIPSNATFAANTEFPIMALMALGYDVKCASTDAGLPFSTNNGDPPLVVAEARADHTQIAGGAPGVLDGSYDFDELAQCGPQYILGSDSYSTDIPLITAADVSQDDATTLGMQFGQLAPAIWVAYNTIQHGAGYNATSGPVAAEWKSVLMDFAVELQSQGLASAVQRAAVVVSRLDLRAAAIRGQVAGLKVVEIEVHPGDWSVGNEYFPEDNVFYGPDLGMTPVLLPPADYGSYSPGPEGSAGCFPGDAPTDCYAPALSNEDFYLLDPAYLLIADATSTTAPALKSDPLFTDIPAVKAGRFLVASGEIRLSPQTTAYDYTLVENTLHIAEYHATVTGKPGATASVTLDPATRKVCYAVDPTAGRLPADSITLTGPALPVNAANLEGRKVNPVPLVVQLAKRASYVNPEPISGWQTSPATYQAAGCVTLSKSVAATLSRKPSKFALRFGSASGRLVLGSVDPVYGS